VNAKTRQAHGGRSRAAPEIKPRNDRLLCGRTRKSCRLAKAKPDSDRFQSGAKYAAYLRATLERLRCRLGFRQSADFLVLPQSRRSLRGWNLGLRHGSDRRALARLGIHMTLLDSSSAMRISRNRAHGKLGVTEGSL